MKEDPEITLALKSGICICVKWKKMVSVEWGTEDMPERRGNVKKTCGLRIHGGDCEMTLNQRL